MREKRRREAVEELLREIGAVMEVREVKRMVWGKEEGRKIVWVKLGSEQQRGELFERKRRLGGRRKLITEDLTWKERRNRWKMREIARM